MQFLESLLCLCKLKHLNKGRSVLWVLSLFGGLQVANKPSVTPT